MRRVLRGLALMTTMLMAALVYLSGPAYADSELGLSTDGVTWSDELSGTLFPEDHVWVPGDRMTRTLWVRNQTPDLATLLIDVTTRGSDDLFGPGDAVIRATAEGRTFQVDTSGTTRLVRLDAITGRSRVPIRLTVELPPSSVNISQTERTSLLLDVRLRRAGPGVDPGPDQPDQPGGLLPDTGSELAWWTPLLAAALLGVGLALIVTNRKDPDHG